MNQRRRYTSPVRAAQAAATRQRIIDTARDLLVDPRQDATLERIAQAAGVSVQTVLRNFGSRAGLVVEAVGTFRGSEVPEVSEPFATVAEGVSRLFDDYEVIGDRVMRVLADEHRIPGFAEAAAQGRRMHRRWVEVAFGDRFPARKGARRTTAVTAVVAATDVYVWRLLRGDLGLDRAAAEQVVVHLVEGALGDEEQRDG